MKVLHFFHSEDANIPKFITFVVCCTFLKYCLLVDTH